MDHYLVGLPSPAAPTPAKQEPAPTQPAAPSSGVPVEILEDEVGGNVLVSQRFWGKKGVVPMASY